MTQRKKQPQNSGKRERHISVRVVRREPKDLRRYGRAVLQLALEQAAAEAAAQEQADTPAPKEKPDA